MQADLSDNSPTPVTQALDRAGVPYRFFRHTGVVRSLEQAAQERGQQPQQVVRSLLFRLAEDEFVMVLVAGPRQLSWPRLRAYLGTKRMTMATDEEVLQVTGYPPGAVSPFGLPQPLRLLVDPAVLEGMGLDPERWSGFAAGLGVERFCMVRHGIDDIRRLFTSDLRFLEQF